MKLFNLLLIQKALRTQNYKKPCLTLNIKLILNRILFYMSQVIITSSQSQSTTESVTITASNVQANNTLTSTSSSSSISSSTRQKFVPSVTPNPKVKKRGSSHTTTDSSKVKKSAHAGNVQNVNSSREALSQEGSDQQVEKTFLA